MKWRLPGGREARELIEQLRTVQAGGLAAKLMLEAAHWIEDAIAASARVPAEPTCQSCRQTKTKNPHPKAGDPSLEFGYQWECIPCLVRTRRSAVERFQRAELAAWRLLQPAEPVRRYGDETAETHYIAAPKAPAENTSANPMVQAELRKFLAALDQMSEGGNVCPGWDYHHSKRVVRAAIDAIASEAGKAPAQPAES